MGRAPATFRQADLARAVKAARSAGLDVSRTEIAPDGTIRLYHDKPEESDNMTPFQRWKAGQGAREAEGH